MSHSFNIEAFLRLEVLSGVCSGPVKCARSFGRSVVQFPEPDRVGAISNRPQSWPAHTKLELGEAGDLWVVYQSFRYKVAPLGVLTANK